MEREDLKAIARWNSVIFKQLTYPVGSNWVELRRPCPDDTIALEAQWIDDLLCTRLVAKQHRVATDIKVIDLGAVGAIHDLKRNGNGSGIGVLNFASPTNPGGGYMSGAMAQEEDLCRCSTLYLHLAARRDWYDIMAASTADGDIAADHVLFSRNVQVFRDEQYRLQHPTSWVAVAAAAAPNLSEWSVPGRRARRAEIEQRISRKIERVLRVFLHFDRQNLVLGAWGCGVFQNDPEMVAELFKQHLTSDAFKGTFDRVLFAIPAGTSERSRKNLNAFQRVFEEG